MAVVGRPLNIWSIVELLRLERRQHHGTPPIHRTLTGPMRSWCQAVEERCVSLKLLLLLSTWRVFRTRQVTLLFAHTAKLRQRFFEAAGSHTCPSRA